MIDTVVLWFRHDLRLRDNPALAAALSSDRKVVPAFIHWPRQEHPWSPGPASRWWLHHSLGALNRDLRKLGSRLLIRRGPAPEQLLRLAQEVNARTVYWNRSYEAAAYTLERQVRTALANHRIEGVAFDGALLHRPEAVLNRQGAPYRVFTAFWKRARLEPAGTTLTSPPKRMKPPPGTAKGLDVEDLELIGRGGEPIGGWTPGESGAVDRLRQFIAHALSDYPRQRDLPATPGTSRLSPHLHFGEIAPSRVLAEIQRAKNRKNGPREAAEAFERQLYWREFAHYILYHFPHTAEHPLDERFAHFPWSGDRALLSAWKKGLTGFPMVDAAMRELLETGWMHNRSRMIVASLLTKNLRIHWLEGVRWFWERLVDADLANNSFGWQWTAGCGADAAPFFRVFNPTRQGERYDPHGHYVRQWVPELAALPNRWIHRPWEAPPDILTRSAIRLGKDYPLPVVRLSASREQALLAYRKLPRRRKRTH